MTFLLAGVLWLLDEFGWMTVSVHAILPIFPHAIDTLNGFNAVTI